MKLSSQQKSKINSRFWPKVLIAGENECWNWTAARNEKGYGLCGVNGRTQGAHRVSWMLNNGPIEDGMIVMHKCDNPSCVNPLHLSLGTHAQNTADAIAKGRYPQITVNGIDRARGERNGQAKLSESEVNAIRQSKDTGRLLASRFKVCETTIRNIKRLRKWRHI